MVDLSFSIFAFSLPRMPSAFGEEAAAHFRQHAQGGEFALHVGHVGALLHEADVVKVFFRRCFHRALAHLLLLHKHSRLTHIEGRRGEEVVEGDAETEAEGEHEPAAVGLADAPQVGERYEIFCAGAACIFCVHALICFS